MANSVDQISKWSSPVVPRILFEVAVNGRGGLELLPKITHSPPTDVRGQTYDNFSTTPPLIDDLKRPSTTAICLQMLLALEKILKQ